MSGAATDLYDAASHLLDFSAAVLEQTPAGAPERRFVSVGFPAIDCATLAVFVMQEAPGPFAPSVSPGDPFRQGHPNVVLDMVTFQLQVHRCWPSTPDGKPIPKAPKPENYDAATEILYTDAWLLWNAFRQGVRAGLLGGPCKLVRADALQPIQPDGAFAGMGFILTAQLDGFDPVLPDPEP